MHPAGSRHEGNVAGGNQADIPQESRQTDDGIANYDYYRMVFGRLEELPHSANNPEYLLERLQLKKLPIPEIFMCIGTEDFLYEPNQIFRSFLTEHKVDFQYREGPGAHDFHTVGFFLEDGLRFLMEGKQ